MSKVEVVRVDVSVLREGKPLEGLKASDCPEAANSVPDLKERLERLRSVVLTIP